MKKLTLFFLAFSCVFALSAQNASSKKVETKETTKREKRTEAVKADETVKKQEIKKEKGKKEKTAVIYFENIEHDYGTIYQGDNGECEFVFINKGKSPLVLTRCYSSCGCTVPSWPKDPIPPKRQGVIKVKYNTGHVGTISKTVTVESNAENGKVVLRIKGTVKAKPIESVPENTSTPLSNPAAE
jgi:hypothetical protein